MIKRWKINREGWLEGCESGSIVMYDDYVKEAARATAEQSRDKWVAIVRVTNEGYAMELSKYIAYALPEGAHELYAAPKKSTPEGWMLVPIEPTHEMLMAGYRIELKYADRAEMYRAMLAAIESQRSGDGS